MLWFTSLLNYYILAYNNYHPLYSNFSLHRFRMGRVYIAGGGRFETHSVGLSCRGSEKYFEECSSWPTGHY